MVDVDADRMLIIIPAYNEEQALPGVLADLACIEGVDVLVIDDGSADRTSQVAREGGAYVATLPFNLGIGGALRTGFRYAARHGYTCAVQFDADGQHLAPEIEVLRGALHEGADIVIGTRFAGDDQSYAVGKVRSGGMRVLRMLILLLAGDRLSDTSSGFRGFNRRAIELFASSYPAEYLDSVEALLLALQSGLRVREVPVRMRERQGGVASNRSWKLAYHYVRVVVVLASSVRLSRAAGRRAAARDLTEVPS